MSKFLKSKTMLLRAIEPEDLEVLYKWENDTDVWKYGSAISPYSKYILRQYIVDAQTDIYKSKQLRFMISLHKQNCTIGTIDLYNFDVLNSRCGVGIYIDSAYRTQGYAKQALSLLEDYVFSFLNVNQLYALIPKENKASLNLFSSANYVESGILKQWISYNNRFEDVIIVQKLKTRDNE